MTKQSRLVRTPGLNLTLHLERPMARGMESAEDSGEMAPLDCWIPVGQRGLPCKVGQLPRVSAVPCLRAPSIPGAILVAGQGVRPYSGQTGRARRPPLSIMDPHGSREHPVGRGNVTAWWLALAGSSSRGPLGDGCDRQDVCVQESSNTSSCAFGSRSTVQMSGWLV